MVGCSNSTSDFKIYETALVLLSINVLKNTWLPRFFNSKNFKMSEPEKWIIIGLQPRSRSYSLSAIFSSTHKPTESHISGFLEFLLPLPIPGKGTVDLIYTAICLLKLLFHTCIFWLNISEEAVTFLQKCTYISLPITLLHFFFFFNYRGSYD